MDVKFDEDGWSSSSQEPPTKILEREKVVVMKFDSEDKSK